jgi:hypothetical protein
MSAKTVLKIGLASLLLAFPLAAYSKGASSSDTAHLVLPQGQVLSEDELLEVTGDSVFITIVAGILLGGSSGAVCQIATNLSLGQGFPPAAELALATGYSALAGIATSFASPAVTNACLTASTAVGQGAHAIWTGAVSAARWIALSAASFGTSAQSFLHQRVRMPIQNELAWRLGKPRQGGW